MLVTRQTCRLCGSHELTSVLSLGDQYLASFFTDEHIPPLRRRIPLELVRCDVTRDENACGLVQLKHTVPSDFMYSAYGYKSGINESMAQHLRDLAQKAQTIAELKPSDIAIDIGANDATLLKGYTAQGTLKVGFEPSNVAPTDAELPSDIRYLRTYFDSRVFESEFPEKKAKVITSIAMFYDLEHPNRFVSDIARVLDRQGIWVMELSYLPMMLKQRSFDTVCHEHLDYYHLAPIEKLVEKHGLKVFDVETNLSNGGSFRLYIAHEHSRFCERKTEAHRRLIRFRQAEFELCLDQEAIYAQFRSDIEKIRKDLNTTICDLKKQGKKIYGYGASTKGNVILQYCELDQTLITAIADRNPSKHGQKTLGTDIPIISEEDARKQNPDYFLVLPWHFLNGFMQRERAFLERGGRFIVPLPEVRVVGP